MLQVRNKVALFFLQISVFVRVNSSTGQIGVKCWLSRNFARIYLFGPKRMLSEMFPGNALYRVFFKQTAQQIIKNDRKSFNMWQSRVLDLRYQVTQALGCKWRATSRHLKQYTAESPAIRLKAVHSIISKELRCHIIWCTALFITFYVQRVVTLSLCSSLQISQFSC